jgi:SAM-dependent methyltransferase
MRTDTQRWAEDALFCEAWAYDLAFQWDISDEVAQFIARAALRPGDAICVPACGTGRYAEAFAEAGLWVYASDINPAMVEFARTNRAHEHIQYSVEDMTRALGGPVVAAGFCMCNSFRYVLDRSHAEAHLRLMHAKLAAGGTYALELALNNAAAKPGVLSHWRMEHDEVTVEAKWSLQRVEGELALETAELTARAQDGTTRSFRDDQPQLLWTYAALAQLATDTGFRVADVRHRGPGLPAASDPHRPGGYIVFLHKAGAQ